MAHAWRVEPAAGLRLFRALLKFWRARLRFGDQLAVATDGLNALATDATTRAVRAELHMQSGSACIALERIDEADAHIAQSDALLSGDALAAQTLLWRVCDLQGLLAQRRGDLDGALALHQRAATLAPRPAEATRAKMHVGRAAAMSGRFAEAETVLVEVCDALAPEDENSLLASLLLAHTWTMLDKLDAAARLLARCQTLSETFRLYDWRGAIHMAQGALFYLRGDTDAALCSADAARVEFAAIADPMPVLANCDFVRSLLMLERGDLATGLPIVRAYASGRRFAEDSVAGVAALAGLAIGLSAAGSHVDAEAAASRIAIASASIDLPRRVFADASPIELAFAKRVMTRFGARSEAPAASAELTLNDAIARALARLQIANTR
jgi:tetratricopeptide (TPR) repeat protein